MYSLANIWLLMPLKCYFDALKSVLRLQSLGITRQLINNAICLLLTTGIYTRPFEEWDHLQPNRQMWVALCVLIQESFQCHLNATAPTARHHGYAPALTFQQNAFGTLAGNNNEDLITISVANQVATLTYQSQLTASTTTTTTQRNQQQFAAIEANQHATHTSLHQIS